VLFM